MSAFPVSRGELHVERVSLATIAERFGTPCYVYSRAALEANYDAFDAAFAGLPHLVCYAMKANSNLAILNLLARRGAGFDIVSGGELERVIAAGGDPAKTVFSGVGKSALEMEAGLACGIRCFNVESAAELEVLNAVAGRVGKRAPISIRVNPDVDPKTHPYIATGLKESKFGVAYNEAPALYAHAAGLAHIDVQGLDCHIGSQITDAGPYLDALDRLLELVEAIEARGIEIRHLDLGGGLGITYTDEKPPAAEALVRSLLERIDARGHGHRKVMFEPGRSLVGNAGVLVSEVLYVKPGEQKNFCIVDAAMNDLMRPAMYQAYMAVEPCTRRNEAPLTWDVVGPICESGDWLARERELALREGDRLAVLSAGAYGMSMASNYNTRPRAAELMVDGARVHLIRQREEAQQLFTGERLITP